MTLLEAASVAGAVGGCLSVGAFLPQVYRILSRRSASDVSLSMYLVIMLAAVLWMFYAYAYGSVELLLTNLLILIIASIIAALRLHFGRR